MNKIETQPDLSLVSKMYIEESFSNQIVAEVLNNGTESAEFVEDTTSFYDAYVQIVLHRIYLRRAKYCSPRNEVTILNTHNQ